MMNDGKISTKNISNCPQIDLVFVLPDSEKKNYFRDEKTENEILVYCNPIAL